MHRMGFVSAVDKIEILKGQVLLQPLSYPATLLRSDWMCLTSDTHFDVFLTVHHSINLFLLPT
jgi:hypothetical protein